MSEPADDEIEAAYVIAETVLDPTMPLADTRARFHRWADQLRAEAWGEGVTTALQHLGVEVKWHDPIFERNPYREDTAR